MTSKTPQFDAALDKILNGLSPHKRACKQCAAEFDIFAEDIEFLKMLRVPPPTLCPLCRQQRRFGYRVYFLPIFHKKTCTAPGHNEKIVSYYSELNPTKVYDDTYYHSDAWDAISFGKDYDFSRPFFEQWREFSRDIPRQSLFRDIASVAVEYTISGVGSKNCYYVAVPYYAEDVYYGSLPVNSRNCVDVCDTDNAESCYSSASIENCYRSLFCYESANCLDSAFLYDCRNCHDCFGCTNLRNKQYCFFNEQLTKEEYEKRLKNINLGKRSELLAWQKKFQELLASAIRKATNNLKVENCLGDNLRGCKNCFKCFRVINGGENLRYVCPADRFSNAMDATGAQSSFAYETSGVIHAQQIRFSSMLRTGREVEYSMECNNCDYVFGCVGLKNKKYCIFNKQYTEDEYWPLVDEIKTKMLATLEYGEFFPLKMSAVAYEDSSASIDFPLSEEEIARRGWHMKEREESDIDLSKMTVLKPQQVPDNISDVTDGILKTPIICERTGKPFRITPFELGFYRSMRLPIPTIHPLERIRDLLKFRRPFRLFRYPCSKCGKDMDTSFDPALKYKVYCEQCYQQEVV